MRLRQAARAALADEQLRANLAKATDRLGKTSPLGLSNYQELRDSARAIKTDVIENLPQVLDEFATNVEARGGRVFWAATGDEANEYIQQVARSKGAKLAVKSKSMVTEEIHLNKALSSIEVETIETDLGEWIIQLAGEQPSHILAPAIHKSRRQIAELFSMVAGRRLSDDPTELCAFAREQLREKFLSADIGISGVNFGIAETGSLVLVTNEGNGRMVTSIPPVHIAVMGMERVVRTWKELDVMLALLPRAASGQKISVYVNVLTGPRVESELHLVIVDNGRSRALGTEFQEMLNCIRCGACLNVCPVYRQIGGHAYSSGYSGPMGAVLTPLLNPESSELAQASTLCGACWEACPVKIPLQDMLLALRRRSPGARPFWNAWAAVWGRPQAYLASARVAANVARRIPSVGARKVPRPSKPSFRDWFEQNGD